MTIKQTTVYRICPRCGSGQIRARIRNKDFVCNKCGHFWKMPKTNSVSSRCS